MSSSLRRVSTYPWLISKVFQSGDMRLLHIKGELQAYQHSILSKLIEMDKMAEFFTIQKLGYDPKIIEGTLKLTEIISNRAIFPHMVNRKFEIEFDHPELRDIFGTTEDIVDFSLFIVYCLINNIVGNYIRSPRANSTLQKMKTKGQAFKCLVKNCKRICFGYNNIWGHLIYSVEKKHVLAVAEARKDLSKRGKYGMSWLESLFKRIEEHELPKKLPKQYFKSQESVLFINVKCKHCEYTGAYRNFCSHIVRKHKELLGDVVGGDRCKYENDCIWP